MKKLLLIISILWASVLLHLPAYAAFPIKTITTAPAGTPDNGNTATVVAVNTEIRESNNSILTPAPDRNYHYRPQKLRYRNMAILFCIVCLGLHRLYLGYTYTGLAQLTGEIIAVAALLSFAYLGSTLVLGYLLYYAGAMLVWQIIDLIHLLRGKLQPKHGYYTNDHRLWRRHRHGVKNGF